MRNTKIVATLGPASDTPEQIRRLMEAGADVFRLNASHGTREDHRRLAAAVRQASAELGVHAGLLLDLQGPKIRLGDFAGGGCVLQTGARFTITTEPVLGTSERASTSYTALPWDVRPGDRILLADGAVELRVLATDATAVHTEVVSGGPIGDRKGINLPGVPLSVPSLTEKDLADLELAQEPGVDIVALSFVRRPEDVRSLRDELARRGLDVPIVAKIEKPEAWHNLDAILAEANGVMVARGDLGVELELEKVPFIQKAIIERARTRGRYVITATQMLESMVDTPWPTRAEVSDVANAIYDGTDAVMLSEETSVGKYPVEAVRMMARIAAEADSTVRTRGLQEPPHGPNPSYAEIVADAAHQAAHNAGLSAIVVFTATGFSARLIARYRPRVPIYAFTPSDAVARRLSPVYGVRPILAPDVPSTDDMLALMDRVLIERRLVRPGDGVVFVAGQPIGRAGTTNLLKLHRVGELR
ncbi:MAG: pyruvate kinase [Bryobacterales bacterium]|nr:pyruvate kinase [Bryobacteraceae bacterium]MDW8353159.1 pyruvate kinase [Bryobacterales bacterium]